MVDVLGGDVPRANSIIKVGQASKLLSASLGRGSAALKSSDFPALLGLTLTPEGPTKAPEAVRRMWSLPLWLLAFDPGDGHVRDVLFPVPERNLPRRDEQIREAEEVLSRRCLRVHYDAGRTETTFLDILHQLFLEYAPHHEFLEFDQIELRDQGGRMTAGVKLKGPSWETEDLPRGTGEGNYAIILGFMQRSTASDASYEPTRCLETTRTLGAAGLNALARLTPNCTKEARDVDPS
ncbi:hypothetical protein [Rubellimicrobium roseum]|uniref:Uncharacterized protein n=1 Tax=Rubellimicrobium roseum TaxID=687525 RepID=A0A5C4NHQ4_9RHOB|nr:hypothetical protein [Rubellimicrobium roseum]TNC74143.1 hypothetical protein FHG71_02815 [Rubellimicrobium roseum]